MANAKYKYTVIIGTYNQLTYLPKLVEALENQTFRDFEVIFCDDGSDDGTKEYIKNLKVNFPLKYKRQFHFGMRLSKNINQGIKAAQGEYCVFIMGDSFPELNYLEKLNEYVHPDFCVCGVRHHIDNGKAVDIDWRLKKRAIPEFPMIMINIPQNVLTGNGLTIPTEAFKNGGWCEKIKGYGGDDTELVARLYYQGYIFWSTPDLILYHHWHKASVNNPQNYPLIEKMTNRYAKIT